MNKTASHIFILFLFFHQAFAEESFFQNEYAVIELAIKGEAQLIPESRFYDIENVNINLSFVPQNSFQQEIISLKTTPQAELKGSAASFSWDEPEEKTLSFILASEIKTSPTIVQVTEAVPFPITGIAEDLEIYTMPSETIDSEDEGITALANELAKGENDLYKVVFKLAEWSNENIEYDLTTLTKSSSQKASWVLKNKKGVCDELTSLFIALNRALGIPAKFISGIAYSETLGEKGFGPHGWAEVYFPKYGWIPFDVTFGEFGRIDEFHIKLKEGLDPGESSTRYSWLGSKVSLKTEPLDIKAKVLKKEKKKHDLIDIRLIPYKKEVGFGSYNLFEAKTENLEGFYLPTWLMIAKSDEVEVIEYQKKHILLKPDELKSIFWTIKVSDSLQKNYVYSFPFHAVSQENTSSSASFESRENYAKISLGQLQQVISDAKLEESKTSSRDLLLECSPQLKEMYQYQQTRLLCNVKNIGNVLLEGVSVCHEEKCKNISIPISKSQSLEFDFSPKEPGFAEAVIKASADNLFKRASADILVLDEPKIGLSNITHPESVKYRQSYDILFTLEKLSSSEPKNIGIILEPLSHKWVMDHLTEDRKFSLKLIADDLAVGANKFALKITFEDKNQKTFEVSGEFYINLSGVTLSQRIMLFFKTLPRRISGLFRYSKGL